MYVIECCLCVSNRTSKTEELDDLHKHIVVPRPPSRDAHAAMSNHGVDADHDHPGIHFIPASLLPA